MRTLILLLVVFSSVAGCAQRQLAPTYPPPPTVLAATPSLAEVTAAVNRTASIRQLASNTASVDVLSQPGIPTLNATLNFEREKNFRLQAKLPVILGSGLDMGSNEQLFWFEVPERLSQTLYYAGHDAYRQQLSRSVLPVDPTFVVEALGLVQIDPATVIAGPVVRPDDGKLEICSQIATTSGNYQRVYMIDASAGYVTNQYVYAPGGDLVAYSEASNPRFYEAEQCVLPHTVKLTLNSKVLEPMQLQIDVGMYATNQLLSNDPNLFVMPQTAGKAIDLTTITGNASVAPVNYQQQGPLGPLPYRGLVR